jgi:hypothetical protein
LFRLKPSEWYAGKAYGWAYMRGHLRADLLLVQEAQASVIPRRLTDAEWAAVATKRLSVHKVLMEGEDVAEAANFMRGMWRDIDRLCRERGF